MGTENLLSYKQKFFSPKKEVEKVTLDLSKLKLSPVPTLRIKPKGKK